MHQHIETEGLQHSVSMIACDLSEILVCTHVGINYPTGAKVIGGVAACVNGALLLY
jgi:hypothetical protein